MRAVERRIDEHLVVRRDGAVVTVTVNREDALGALSRSMLVALDAFLPELAADDDVRAVVLTGTGRGFVAGADIGEYDGVDQRRFDDYQRLGRRVFDAVEALPQYTVAAVNGYALGGGFELALCCDAILATERAKFGLPEVKLGLLPGGGGSQRLARALGVRFTLRLIATGAMVPAGELHRRGLVDEVYADADALRAGAGELAGTVAAGAPLAVRAAKRLVREGSAMPLPNALEFEQSVLSSLFATEDGREGVAAFVEKRDPEFRGR